MTAMATPLPPPPPEPPPTAKEAATAATHTMSLHRAIWTAAELNLLDSGDIVGADCDDGTDFESVGGAAAPTATPHSIDQVAAVLLERYSAVRYALTAAADVTGPAVAEGSGSLQLVDVVVSAGLLPAGFILVDTSHGTEARHGASVGAAVHREALPFATLRVPVLFSRSRTQLRKGTVVAYLHRFDSAEAQRKAARGGLSRAAFRASSLPEDGGDGGAPTKGYRRYRARKHPPEPTAPAHTTARPRSTVIKQSRFRRADARRRTTKRSAQQADGNSTVGSSSDGGDGDGGLPPTHPAAARSAALRWPPGGGKRGRGSGYKSSATTRGANAGSTRSSSVSSSSSSSSSGAGNSLHPTPDCSGQQRRPTTWPLMVRSRKH